jgi:octaprenyl-diphosphate synthase
LVDDALDIEPENLIGKSTGGDLREGKITPLLQFYLETLPPPDREVFTRRFSQAAFNEEELQATLLHMRKSDAAGRVRALADEYLRLAETRLEQIPRGQERDVLTYLLGHIRDRKH